MPLPSSSFAPYFADARITNVIDLDGDGSARKFAIAFDVNSNVAGQYYVNIYEEDDWLFYYTADYLTTSATFNVSGTAVDWQMVTLTTDDHPDPNLLGEGGLPGDIGERAEFRIDLYDAATNTLVQTWHYDDTRPSGLLAQYVELSASDFVDPHFADARIADVVDMDGDGYARQFDIQFDVDSAVAGRYYVEVYEDDGLFGPDDYLATSGTFDIFGVGTDWQTITLVADDLLGRCTAELRLDLYDAATNVRVQTWHYSDSGLTLNVEPSADDVPPATISGNVNYRDLRYSVDTNTPPSPYSPSSVVQVSTGDYWNPVRGATVQLIDSAGAVLAETKTNPDGSYSVSGSDFVGKRIQLVVLAESDAGKVTQSGQVVEFKSAASVLVAGSADYTLDLNLDYGKTTAAWNVLDMVQVGYDFARLTTPTEAIDPVDVRLVDNATGTSFYSPGVTNDITINLRHAYSDWTILHEYGHFYTDLVSTGNGPSYEKHYANLPMVVAIEEEPFDDTLELAREDAWSEGLATFFAGVALQLALDQQWTAVFGGLRPDQYVQLSWDPTSQTLSNSLGYSLESTNWVHFSTVESAVTEFLWDLYDNTADAHDPYNNTLGFSKIFDLIDEELDYWVEYDAPDVTDFYNAWIAKYPADQSLIDPIFNYHFSDISELPVNDRFFGSDGAERFEGLAGDDTLFGGAGVDTLIGGLGNDTYGVGGADIVIEGEGAGFDEVWSTVSYTLPANVENLKLLETARINGMGNGLANILTGNTANNTLDGKGGNDTMLGGAGDDIYRVDHAGDVVTEADGEGTDTVKSRIDYTLTAHVENLTLTGTAAINGTGNDLANTLTGNGAANVLDGGAGNDTLIGGAGKDTYVVDSAGDVVTEATGGGKDTVQARLSHTLAANVEDLTLTGTADINGTGNGLANILTGNAGANVLDGKGGNDTLIGGVGDDTYVVNGGDTVTELDGEGTDLVNSSVTHTLALYVENLTLTGTTAINGTGNELANALTGNATANVLDGKAGDDTLRGGLGNDTYVVDAGGDTVVESADPGSGMDTVKSSVNYELTANVERLTLTGTAAIDGTGNDLRNTLTGNTGNNLLDGGLENDSLQGGAGNDTLAGGLGNDTLLGGSGNDVYRVDSLLDKVYETTTTTSTTNAGGIDSVESSVTWTLGSYVEHLTLTGTADINGTGNSLNNVLSGNSGGNVLNGKGGSDTLIGGGGDDRYVVNGGDTVDEEAGAGIDVVISTVGYTLTAHVENLTLTGTAAINGTGNALDNTLTGNVAVNVLDGGLGADTMIGGAGNDTYGVDSAGDVVVEAASGGTDIVRSSVSYALPDQVEKLTLTGTAAIEGTGNGLANTLTGNTGNNLLAGGLGNDTLTGGGGRDMFRFDTVLNATTNRDTISDFSVADDTLVLSAAVFADLDAGALTAEAFWKSATATTAHDADDRIVYNTTTGAIYYDVDGTGTDAAPIRFATLAGSPDGVTAADFMVVT